MKKFIQIFLCALFLTSLPGQAFAGAAGDIIKLRVGSDSAYINGIHKELPVAPCIHHQGAAMVPLLFLAEIVGADYTWNNTTKEAVLHNDSINIRLRAGSRKILVNGEEVICKTAPYIRKDALFVPVQVLKEGFNYKLSYIPGTKEIHIKKLPPNQPPVADFVISKNTVAQGETVVYDDKSYDPDGDKLVDVEWKGNKRAFFAPGEYKVVLRVKDSRGEWSEPCTKTITVTEEVKMDKFYYFLHNPVPGEILELPDYKVLQFKTLDPAVTMNREKIMISNSPEKIHQEGILYSDILEGENRVYYHHINDSSETKRVFLLAKNQGKKPVRLTVKKSGTAGPADPMAVGRAAAHRFLDYKLGSSRFLSIAPGEVCILNKGQSSIAKPGKAVHGIFDINAHDDLLFAVVSVSSPGEVSNFEELSDLLGDGVHLRGTYERANRSMLVRVQGETPSRLVVADGKTDSFLYGKDESLVRKNKGNYGLSYRVTIKSVKRVGVLFSARGGVFAGAGEWDGEVFYLPNKGVLNPQKECAVIGVVKLGTEKVLEFIPPAGSSLPVNLLFIPF